MPRFLPQTFPCCTFSLHGLDPAPFPESLPLTVSTTVSIIGGYFLSCVTEMGPLLPLQKIFFSQPTGFTRFLRIRSKFGAVSLLRQFTEVWNVPEVIRFCCIFTTVQRKILFSFSQALLMEEIDPRSTLVESMMAGVGQSSIHYIIAQTQIFLHLLYLCWRVTLLPRSSVIC